MTEKVTVLFDGRVLLPQTPLDLQPNTRYLVSIEPEAADEAPVVGDAWDVLEQLTGTLIMPADWASEHDHYLYGTQKTTNTLI